MKVTGSLNSSTEVSNLAYLRLRVSKLNEFQQTVLLIIDEIYIARRMEYTGSKVLGLTPDGKVASTLPFFMVKSVAGEYKDVVAISLISDGQAHSCQTTDNKCSRNIAKNLDRLSTAHKRYRRQTSDRRTGDSTFAKKSSLAYYTLHIC